MTLPKGAKQLISLFENSGFKAYAVGGCVRDFVLNKNCDDVDITTSATPEEMIELFEKNTIRYFKTGIVHGTVTVIANGETYEVTTFRTDGDYLDNRHPDSVCFVRDIKEDLSRRDFTINAMAYNDNDGIIDMFGGKKDLENKLVRAVGDADKRFKEDALRIMRAIRFASVLNFNIEETTKKAIFDNKELLKNVSSPRIYNELSKLLMGDNVYNVLIEFKDVIAVVIPQLEIIFNIKQNTVWHIYDVWHHTAKSVEQSPKDLSLRYTMLLHDIGKAFTKTTDLDGVDHFKGHQKISGEYALDILKNLNAPNCVVDRAMAVIPIHDMHIGRDRKNVKKWLNKLGENTLRDLIAVKRADKLAQNLDLTSAELENLKVTEEILDSIIELKEPFGIKDLSINGKDLISLGYKGKEIGQMLDNLINMVIEEKISNNKDDLISYVKKQTRE